MIGIVITLIIVLTIISCTIICVHYKKCICKISFKDTIGKIGIPIVSFEQNGKSFNFIIDSGADQSVLKSSVLTQLDYVNLEGNGCVYGIDGNQVQVSYVGIKFFSQNHKFIEAFQVFDTPGLENIEEEHNIKVAGILGSSFLRRYGFLINFKQLVIYSHGKENQIKNA